MYITSDAGEGKTCVINELARHQAKRFKDRNSEWLLIPVPLGGRSFLRFDDIVAAALANRYRFPYFYYAAFIELVRLGVLVPAFDGFEEMFVENTSGEALSAMGILLNTLQSSGSLVVAARNTELNRCKFLRCHFGKLDLFPSTKFSDVNFDETTFDSIRVDSKGIVLYDPGACRAELVQMNVSFGEGPVLITQEHLRQRTPEVAVKQMGRVLKYFLRSTHISESIIRMRLGNGAIPFINDCIPALLNRGIFVVSDRYADSRQRHYKLGRPMATLNQALEDCDGEFSQFLDLGGRQSSANN